MKTLSNLHSSVVTLALVASWLLGHVSAAQAAPANNNFASRTTISSSGGTVSGSNVGATKESGEPNHPNDPGGKSVWWTWTPSTSGSAVIKTLGSSFDTILAVYTGSSVSGLTLVPNGSNDDYNGAAQSQVTVSVTAGVAYQIAVDGYGGESGNVSLTVTPPTVALPTVTISASDSSAAEAGANTGTFTFTRSGSTASSLTVNYSIGGSAGNGSDYSSIATTISIPAGSSSVTRTITPIDDTAVESTETVGLTLTSGSYTIGSPNSATVNITDNDAQVAPPRFSPSPGTYSDSVRVTASTTTSGATIRYTTSGSDPNGSSPVFPASGLNLTSTTTLKARAFKSGMTDSTVTPGLYTIIVPVVLNNRQTVSGLSGVQGNARYYRVSVPSGQTALSIKISSGSGDCDLYVRYASPPTLSDYNSRPYLNGNLELVTVPAPASGSWFIMLYGKSAYSGVSLQVEYGTDVLSSSLLSGLSGALGYRLDDKYSQGLKPLAYLSAGWTYGIEISLSLYIDLSDYAQVTYEGWNGDWVTMWGRANGAVFGASALPVTLGVLQRSFSATELPDREFPLEVSIVGGTIGPLSVSFLNTSDLSFSPADVSFEAVEANASGWAFSITTPSVSAEFKRSVLDSAVANSITPGLSIIQSVNSLKTHLVGSVGPDSSIVWALPSVRFPSDKTDASN